MKRGKAGHQVESKQAKSSQSYSNSIWGNRAHQDSSELFLKEKRLGKGAIWCHFNVNRQRNGLNGWDGVWLTFIEKRRGGDRVEGGGEKVKVSKEERKCSSVEEGEEEGSPKRRRCGEAEGEGGGEDVKGGRLDR